MNIKFYIIVTIFIIVFGLPRCTKKFDAMDYPKTSSPVIDPSPLFTRTQVTGSGLSVGIWQQTNQLTTLDWVQYVSTIKYNFTQSIYEPVPQTQIWSWWYAQSSFAGLNLCYNTISLARQIKNPIQESIARIWRAYMFQFMTDMWGDIPYSQAFVTTQPKYDNQQFIYQDLIKELQESVASLTQNKNAGYKGYGNADVIYKGDINKWIKFANSMLLRLAMQCSNVAKDQMTVSVLSKINWNDATQYISSNDDNAVIIPDPNGPTFHVKNPYQFVCGDETLSTPAKGWEEMRISSNFYNRMNSKNDPRMKIIMFPNNAGNYVGLPSGQNIANLTSNYNEYVTNYCDMGAFFTGNVAPFVLMSATEINFLIAEAIHKGFISGSANDYYKKAIQANMDFYKVATADATTFITSVSFSEDNLYEQMWIGIFPNGPQAWNLVRRTGKPAILPLIETWPGNATMPRRWLYSNDEVLYNGINVKAAADRMGGDNQYTKVWWDGGQ